MKVKDFCSNEVLRALGCAENINESINNEDTPRIATVEAWPYKGGCGFNVYHDGYTIQFREEFVDAHYAEAWEALEQRVCAYLVANGLVAESDNDRTWLWGLGRPIKSAKEGARLIEKYLEDGEGGHCVLNDEYEEGFFNDLGLEIVDMAYQVVSREHVYIVRANDDAADIDWVALNPQQRASALQEAYNFCYGGDFTIRLTY